MAYAKLSGSLLVRKDAPLDEIVSAPRPHPGEPAPPPPAPPPLVHTVDPEADRLLAERLKELNLPIFLGEYDKIARQCEAEGTDHSHYLLRLVELELAERQRQTADRRIKAARFPAVKDLDSFDFAAVPSLNNRLVLDLARCDYVKIRANVVILGNSGTGKT